jgi:hypothetical protein
MRKRKRRRSKARIANNPVPRSTPRTGNGRGKETASIAETYLTGQGIARVRERIGIRQASPTVNEKERETVTIAVIRLTGLRTALIRKRIRKANQKDHERNAEAATFAVIQITGPTGVPRKTNNQKMTSSIGKGTMDKTILRRMELRTVTLSLEPTRKA